MVSAFYLPILFPSVWGVGNQRGGFQLVVGGEQVVWVHFEVGVLDLGRGVGVFIGGEMRDKGVGVNFCQVHATPLQKFITTVANYVDE